MSHSGSCFCGAVKLEVTGSPEAMGYCHCRSCRSWSGGPGERLQPLEAGGRADHSGGRACRDVPEDRAQPAQVLHQVRRPPDDQSSALGLVDVFAATIPTLDLHARRSRQLRRDGAAHAGRPAQAQGLPSRVRRLRRGDRGIAPRLPTGLPPRVRPASASRAWGPSLSACASAQPPPARAERDP